MVFKALSLLRLQSSGTMRWICCLVLLLLILLRVWGPLHDDRESNYGESALKTEQLPG